MRLGHPQQVALRLVGRQASGIRLQRARLLLAANWVLAA
jgi:hypothetical protein